MNPDRFKTYMGSILALGWWTSRRLLLGPSTSADAVPPTPGTTSNDNSQQVEEVSNIDGDGGAVPEESGGAGGMGNIFGGAGGLAAARGGRPRQGEGAGSAGCR